MTILFYRFNLFPIVLSYLKYVFLWKNFSIRCKFLFCTKKRGSIIYGTDESELILQPHFYFRY
ncbi:hypothetical protein GBM58_02965 [Enterococcus faecium]|nr:hypothetical protein GBM58_02965 [Enterococcus faecium]